MASAPRQWVLAKGPSGRLLSPVALVPPAAAAVVMWALASLVVAAAAAAAAPRRKLPRSAPVAARRRRRRRAAAAAVAPLPPRRDGVLERAPWRQRLPAPAVPVPTPPPCLPCIVTTAAAGHRPSPPTMRAATWLSGCVARPSAAVAYTYTATHQRRGCRAWAVRRFHCRRLLHRLVQPMMAVVIAGRLVVGEVRRGIVVVAAVARVVAAAAAAEAARKPNLPPPTAALAAVTAASLLPRTVATHWSLAATAAALGCASTVAAFVRRAPSATRTLARRCGGGSGRSNIASPKQQPRPRATMDHSPPARRPAAAVGRSGGAVTAQLQVVAPPRCPGRGPRRSARRRWGGCRP